MQRNVALAATALLLGAQFALVQNSRGHGDVQPRAVDSGELEILPEGSSALVNPCRDGEQRVAIVTGWGGAVPLRGGEIPNFVGELNQGGSVRALEVPEALAAK